MTSFAIVNNTTDATLTPEWLAKIAAALDVQCNRDVATWWGGSYRVRACTPDNPPAPDDVVAMLLDTMPAAPDAIGYHDWQGLPQIFIARDQCSSIVDGDTSLSQCLSHELAETIGDEGCDLWADDGSGNEFAHELCDAVERGWYLIDGVAVSDFVLPRFFEPGTLGPYSYLQSQGATTGVPAAPFGLGGAGTYQIRRSSGAGEGQVWGEIRADRMAKKHHWSSRTHRRGVRP